MPRAALALFREDGYRTGEATTLTDLGSVACRQGRYQEAGRYQELALSLFREIGDRAGEAEALNGLGDVLLATGRPGPAQAYYAAALALAGQIGDRHEQARAQAGLGPAHDASVNAAGLAVTGDKPSTSSSTSASPRRRGPRAPRRP